MLSLILLGDAGEILSPSVEAQLFHGSSLLHRDCSSHCICSAPHPMGNRNVLQCQLLTPPSPVLVISPTALQGAPQSGAARHLGSPNLPADARKFQGPLQGRRLGLCIKCLGTTSRRGVTQKLSRLFIFKSHVSSLKSRAALWILLSFANLGLLMTSG